MWLKKCQAWCKFIVICSPIPVQEESVLFSSATSAEGQLKHPWISVQKPGLALCCAAPTIPHPHSAPAEILEMPSEIPSLAGCLLQTSQAGEWLCCSPCSRPEFTPSFVDLKVQQKGSPVQRFRGFLRYCCNKSFTPTPSTGGLGMRRNAQGGRKKTFSLAVTCWRCGFSVKTCDLNYHCLWCRRVYWKTDSFAGKRNQTGGHDIFLK